MKTKPNSNIKEIEKLLESDDELPSDCDDIADVPAYLNENRFDSMNFPWLENAVSLKQCGQNDEISSQCSSLYEQEELTNVTEQKQNKKTIIMNGVLNKQDVMCLKCIGELATEATLYWFINFLLNKDLQSDYKFLKSCLVEDIPSNNNKKEKVSFQKKFHDEKYNYDVIIKV